MRLSICIITYKRPSSLQRLLQSFTHLKFEKSKQPLIEIIIVDNDKDMTAKEIVEEMKESLQWPIKYFVEERRGIPFARNTALSHSKDRDCIAFIDDDEITTESWIDELLNALNTYDADVVGGPVLSLFESKPPDWIIRGKFFDRPRSQSGTVLPYVATNNVLLKYRIIQTVPILFDESFGLSGGTDTDFFMRIAECGFKIIWCDEAIVHEYVPQDRANLFWLLKRSFRKGNFDSLQYIKKNELPFLKNGIKKSVKLLLCLIKLPISLIKCIVFLDNVVMFKYFIELSRISGSLLSNFNVRYEDYK